MVNPEVQSTFQRLSEGKKEFRYIIFKIEVELPGGAQVLIQDREVVVEAAVSQDQLGVTGDDYEDNSKAAFEAFVADLKSRTDGFTDCRYAVFDFKFTCSRVGAGTSKMDKIVFLQLSVPRFPFMPSPAAPTALPSRRRWCTRPPHRPSRPPSARPRSFSSRQEVALRKKTSLQVSDESEMSHRELLSKLTDKYADN